MLDRTQEILKDLEATQESLEAFADDIWLTVDRNDLSTLQDRVRAYDEYRRKVAEFKTLTDDLIMRIRAIPAIQPIVAGPQSASKSHTLDESFTGKAPLRYSLRGHASQDFTYWSDLYAAVCGELAAMDPARFAALPDNPTYTTESDNKRFARSATGFRRSKLIADGIHANVAVDADAFRRLMRQLLSDFGLRLTDLVVYFRE